MEDKATSPTLSLPVVEGPYSSLRCVRSGSVSFNQTSLETGEKPLPPPT